MVVSIGTKHRVLSPLERWPSMISMNRPKMGSRPYEFLFSIGENRHPRTASGGTESSLCCVHTDSPCLSEISHFFCP